LEKSVLSYPSLPLVIGIDMISSIPLPRFENDIESSIVEGASGLDTWLRERKENVVDGPVSRPGDVEVC
jgi:hypothetical protein